MCLMESETRPKAIGGLKEDKSRPWLSCSKNVEGIRTQQLATEQGGKKLLS